MPASTITPAPITVQAGNDITASSWASVAERVDKDLQGPDLLLSKYSHSCWTPLHNVQEKASREAAERQV